jgi:pyruvate-formate lyase-activating enzyme
VNPDIHDYERPTDVLLETTTACNLTCSMCPREGLTRAGGHMSEALWRRLIDEIAAWETPTRIWPAIMGEPLLRGPELFRMIAHARERGIAKVCLNTNLLPLRTAWLDELLACGIDDLYVGVDAVTPDAYAQIRCGGDYWQLLERLDALLDARERRGEGPRVILQFVVQDANEHERDAFIEHWRRSGRRVDLKIRPRVGWSYGVESGAEVRENARGLRTACLWLLRQMAVFWNGDVPRCDSDHDGRVIFGNAGGESLAAIWEKLGALRTRHLAGDFDQGPCATCDDWACGRSAFISCGAEAAETVNP